MRPSVPQTRAQRTDPWRWYCRLCGAEGQHEDRTAAREDAYTHIAEGKPCGRGRHIGASGAGRLLHVWTYGGPRNTDQPEAPDA